MYMYIYIYVFISRNWYHWKESTHNYWRVGSNVEYSAIFDLYNAEENDLISVEELQGNLVDLGCPIPAAEILQSIDIEKDGQVSKLWALLEEGSSKYSISLFFVGILPEQFMYCMLHSTYALPRSSFVVDCSVYVCMYASKVIIRVIFLFVIHYVCMYLLTLERVNVP